MKPKIKGCLALLLALMLVLPMVACGGDGGTESTAPEAPTETGDEAAAPEGSEESEPIKLVFRSWNPNENSIKPAMDAWKALNNGIEVEFQGVDYADHIQTLKVDMAAGTGPDIFGLQDGALMTEFSEFTMDISDRAATTWGDDWMTAKFNSLYMDRIKGKLGTYYGVPLGGTSAGYMFSNSAVFEEFGLEVPKTFDDMKAVCQTLRADGSHPLLADVSQEWIALDVFMSIAGDLNQEKFYSAIEGETEWTDADIVEMFEIWSQLFTEGVLVDGVMGGIDTYEYFVTQTNAAMMWEGSWFYTTMATSETLIAAMDEGANISTFTLDWNGDGTPGPVTTGPDVVVAINKDSPNADAAWEFVSFLVTEGVSKMIDTNLSYIPATTDYVLPAENFNEQAVAHFNFVVDKCNDGTAGYREIPYPDLKAELAQQLQRLGLGDTTPQEAAEMVEAASQAQAR